MKHLKVVLAAGFLAFTTSLFACNSQAKKVDDDKQKHKTEAKDKHKADGKVKHINAKYLRDHIYDYKENQYFVFKGKRPAVLDFYASWCGPCQDLSPKISKLAKKYKGQIDFYKIDTDKEEELSQVFGVHSIPLLIFIPMEGQPIQRVGNKSMAELEELLDKIKVKK